MPFPSPPWSLRGTMWLSLFPVARRTSDRPPGLYGAAFVDYAEGGVLSYRELLVARVVRDGAVPRVHITDIWVDSETSRDGGRSLWAIPKELAKLPVGERTAGPLLQASCEAHLDGSAIASARFTSPRMPTVRAPFRFGVQQYREDGACVVCPVSGNARTRPVLGRWEFGADGPLGWLRGRMPVASVRLGEFRLTFGD